MQIDLADPRLTTDERRDLLKIARRLEILTRQQVERDPPRSFKYPPHRWGGRHPT